jgi:hypothetical protein
MMCRACLQTAGRNVVAFPHVPEATLRYRVRQLARYVSRKVRQAALNNEVQILPQGYHLLDVLVHFSRQDFL